MLKEFEEQSYKFLAAQAQDLTKGGCHEARLDIVIVVEFGGRQAGAPCRRDGLALVGSWSPARSFSRCYTISVG